MKRITKVIPLFLLLIMAIIIVLSVAFSQGNSNGNSNSNNNANVNALKWETQGNNADTSDFIGTTNAIALKMRTNNQERMRITPEGKIGVGISNPLEKFELQGNLRLSGDVIFSNYTDATDTTGKFLFVDEDGRTTPKTLNQLKTLIYAAPIGACELVGMTQNPFWSSAPYKLYSFCPDVWVGIGTDEPQQQFHVTRKAVFGQHVGIGNTDPQARLHIRTNLNNPDEKLFLIERQSGSNDPYAIFQITNEGLVRSREVKVDLEMWPDYVFAKEYDLMPLKNVKTFIEQNGHLPNVPAASEIETDGLNLGETAKITMEKVEELTLYTIQLYEILEEQQKLIEEQQKELNALKQK